MVPWLGFVRVHRKSRIRENLIGWVDLDFIMVRGNTGTPEFRSENWKSTRYLGKPSQYPTLHKGYFLFNFRIVVVGECNLALEYTFI